MSLQGRVCGGLAQGTPRCSERGIPAALVSMDELRHDTEKGKLDAGCVTPEQASDSTVSNGFRNTAVPSRAGVPTGRGWRGPLGRRKRSVE